MAVNVDVTCRDGVAAKDLILAMIAKIGTGGGQGHVIEYRGSAIESLFMEGRMTICNIDHRGRRPSRHGGSGRDHL